MKKWILPLIVALILGGMAATGFLMGKDRPKLADDMLRDALKHADEVQGEDAMKLKPPHLGQPSSTPSAGQE